MSRPQRNRRLSRRVWSPENNLNHGRPVKRLFTPEIKRMLKDWLVRRRENPYPSRDEKKRLAIETGLTYTQICNWFANWRRKLKNSEHEKAKNSWGTLIKNYNTNARGNVEQFSISSEDSIWEEDLNGIGDGNDDDYVDGDEDDDKNDLKEDKRGLYKKSGFRKAKDGYEPYYVLSHYDYRSNNHKYDDRTTIMKNCNYFLNDQNGDLKTQGCQETTSNSNNNELRYSPTYTKYNFNTVSLHKPKYKQKMMEKYLRDTCIQGQKVENDIIDVETTAEGAGGAAELSKWLESAAKFTPNKNNYFVEWNERSRSTKIRGQRTFVNGFNGSCSLETPVVQNFTSIHHKDELDAAEALANLAFNFRQRMCTVNAIIS